MDGSLQRIKVPPVSRPALLAFGVVAFAVALSLFPVPAHAQLRSGRSVRVLYQDQLAQEKYADAPAHRGPDAKLATGVVQAQYEEAYSIIEGALQDAPPALSPSQPLRSGSDYSQALPGEPYSPEIIDSGVVYAPGYESYSSPESACDGCGCGGLGCDLCCGYGPVIAPTAMAACDPACNPLLALWCRIRVRAEVPLYWRRDQGSPELATTSPVGTAADVAGQLGQSTTDVIYGNGVLFNDVKAGMRLTFSTWLSRDQCYSLMFRYWNAGTISETAQLSSSQFPILARPFFNTTVQGSFEQDAQLIAFPDQSIGNLQVDNRSELDGLELTLARQLYQDRFTRLDWLWGYQYVRIDEGLSIFSNTTVTGDVPGLQGSTISVADRFATNNEFNGMFYGLMHSRRFACWKMETLFRLGLGNLRREVNIAGSTTTSSGGATSVENQGLLARNTNSQPFVDDTFVVLPEVGINFAYRISQGIDFNIGYNYMLVPKVAQPAQQIDFDSGSPTIPGDPTRIPVNLSNPLVGALDPAPHFNERNYWINSLGLGLQLRY